MEGIVQSAFEMIRTTGYPSDHPAAASACGAPSKANLSIDSGDPGGGMSAGGISGPPSTGVDDERGEYRPATPTSQRQQVDRCEVHPSGVRVTFAPSGQ